jgi:hypothetical protein
LIKKGADVKSIAGILAECAASSTSQVLETLQEAGAEEDLDVDVVHGHDQDKPLLRC